MPKFLVYFEGGMPIIGGCRIFYDTCRSSACDASTWRVSFDLEQLQADVTYIVTVK